MLKRVRMFYDLTIDESKSEEIFNQLQEQAFKTSSIEIKVFYLAENKKDLKDICIRIEGTNIETVKNAFDQFVSFTTVLLKEINNESC